MFDQADKLRKLVRQSVKASPVLTPGLPLIAISGGASGVGVSTLAVQLAEQLCRLGKRVVLVDGNPTKPEIAERLAVVSRGGLGDALEGKRSVTEMLEDVGAGCRLLAGIKAASNLPAMDGDSLRNVLTELRSLQSLADLILIDTGSGMNPWVERLWKSAFQILLVTTTDREHLMKSYATVKLAPWGDVDDKVRLVVNRCGEGALVDRIGEGFASTCRKFLGMKVVTPAAPVAERFHRSERDSTHTDAFGQSVRLLAADLLSSTLTIGTRVPQFAAARYDTNNTQAAKLIAEVPVDRLTAQRTGIE